MSSPSKSGGGQSAPAIAFASKTPDLARRSVVEGLQDKHWAEGLPTRRVLLKLATDPRMDEVWNILTRRTPDGALYHGKPGNDPDVLIYSVLPYWSLGEAVDPWLPTSKRAKRDAAAMRYDAGIYRRLSKLVGFSMVFELEAVRLDRMGRSLQRQIKRTRLPARQSYSGEVGGTIRALCVANRALFGKALEGVTAKLIMIIHNVEVSASIIQKHFKDASCPDSKP